MLTFLLASKRSLAAAVVTFIVIDIIVGASLIAADLNEYDVLPNGVRFGFYKTNETRG